MALDKFPFTLVSPERLLSQKDVEMVVVPGADGDIGVLINHSSLISALRPGTIAIFEGGKVVERLFVSGGFAEVTPKGCTVLAEEAIKLDGLNSAEIEKELMMKREDIGLAKNEVELHKAQNQVFLLEARLNAVQNPVYSA